MPESIGAFHCRSSPWVDTRIQLGSGQIGQVRTTSWIPHKSTIRVLHRVTVHSQIVKTINAYAGFRPREAFLILFEDSQKCHDKKLQNVSRITF